MSDEIEKLRRERDEARNALFRADQDALRVEEERDQLRAELKMVREGCDGWLEKCEQLSKERDEAREELAEANARRDDLRTALEWANEERDRLREQLAAKHSECPDCADYAARSGRFAEQADRLQRERDEARAEAKKLGDALTQETRLSIAMATQRDAARASAETYERDWYAAKNEFGTAMEKMREALRATEKRELEALAELDEARAEVVELRADYDRVVADLRRCASEPYEHAPERAAAYRRGAEAMREACARHIEGEDEMFADNGIRALPIPEER